MGMWMVPFGNVLKAHGYEEIIAYCYACAGVAAFISPMIVGALADQRIAPARLLRWLGCGAALFLALAFYGIDCQLSPLAILVAVQVHAIFYAPIFGLATSYVLARLDDPQKQFGPVRAWATVGWMMAGIAVSWGLHADISTRSGYVAAFIWFLGAMFTFALPEVAPSDVIPRRGWRDVLGLEALELFTNRDHRMVFITAALFTMPMAAFYPYTPIHLREAGIEHATGVMAMGQVSEIVTMFCLGGLFARVRLKWVFLGGIGFGIVRYALFALDARVWLLVGISLHGFAFTLFFVTAQIYLEQRIPSRMRARGQALLSVMTGGFGNFFGYLGSGWWKHANTNGPLTQWPAYWLGMAFAMGLVFALFAIIYRGQPGAALPAGRGNVTEKPVAGN